jgi:CheY-like chemotaxis protein
VTVLVPHDHELQLSEDQLILLFQSVRELLINSLKHAGTGQATVMLEHRDGSLSITVSDEGKGFDLAAAAAAAAAAEGTPSGGISSKFGLVSIQERMRALGGKIDLFSAPGQGTTAILTLPLATVRSSSEESLVVGSQFSDKSTPSIQHSTLPSTSVRVLLVDDHIMVRQGLRSVLDAYEDLQVVGEAQDGSEAVSLAGKLRPHVVVMDINMPKMNGIEATARIKAYWPETIVIGISVNTGDDNSHAMKRAGAITLLTKEAAVEQLYEIIKRSVKKGS